MQLQVGCRAPNALPVNPLSIMSDFVFVGSAPNVRPDGLDEKLDFVGAHSMDPKMLPNTIDYGVQYVFYKRLPIDNDSFASDVLPERIRKASLTLVGQPSIAHFFEGGTIFKVQFEYKGKRGLIYNHVDPRLHEAEYRSEWSEHDYVLVLMK